MAPPIAVTASALAIAKVPPLLYKVVSPSAATFKSPVEIKLPAAIALVLSLIILTTMSAATAPAPLEAIAAATGIKSIFSFVFAETSIFCAFFIFEEDEISDFVSFS